MEVCTMEKCFCTEGYCEQLDLPLCEGCHKPHDTVSAGRVTELCAKCEAELGGE
jgi:hypothetical protein